MEDYEVKEAECRDCFVQLARLQTELHMVKQALRNLCDSIWDGKLLDKFAVIEARRTLMFGDLSDDDRAKWGQ